MEITPATGSYFAEDTIKITPTNQDPPFSIYGLLKDHKDDVMKKALTALLLWEEMVPKTAARQLREEAIEALQKYV